MSFVIVEFLSDNTVDFVPEEWMEGRNVCYWPPKHASRFRQILAKPDKITWSLLQVRWIDDAVNYEQARRRARRAINSDEIRTTDDENQPRLVSIYVVHCYDLRANILFSHLFRNITDCGLPPL